MKNKKEKKLIDQASFEIKKVQNGYTLNYWDNTSAWFDNYERKIYVAKDMEDLIVLIKTL